MEKRSMENLLSLIKSLSRVESGSKDNPLTLVCNILPFQAWNPKLFEEKLSISLPTSLKYIWGKTSGLRLFEDITYGQWGLILWSPEYAMDQQEQQIRTRPDDFYRGDLIIGEFLGDSDLIVLRSDSTEPDFGKVMIALPLDKREEWYVASETLEDFLTTFIECGGKKFWENES